MKGKVAEKNRTREEGEEEAGATATKHRTKLPATTVDTGDLSLWSLLRKNIGT